MKFFVGIIVFLIAVVVGIKYLLNSPTFYDYIYSKPEISPKFCYYYGEILYQSGRADKAENFFNIVISTYPSHELAPLALVKMADIKNENFKYQEALELYKKFVADYPNHPKVMRVNKNIEIIMSR